MLSRTQLNELANEHDETFVWMIGGLLLMCAAVIAHGTISQCVCVCDYLYDNRSLITRIIDTLVSLFDAHARTHSAGHTQTQRDNERWPQTFPCVILEQCNLLNVLCLLCSPPSHRSVHPACEGLFLYLSLSVSLYPSSSSLVSQPAPGWLATFTLT